MPKNHARKNQLAALKDQLGVKHADAIALLDHPDPDDRVLLCEYLDTYADITTYKDAVAFLEQERNDPANELLCEKCGWTVGMVCPECPGCGCYNLTCTGWRHREYWTAEEEADFYECPECGGDTRNHYDCTCGDE
jgi:hypothetical protein